MSLAQVFGFILLLIMIKMVYDTTRFVSSANFQGRGIYYITINAWFRNNEVFKEWLRQNSIYHWCMLFVIALCPTILLLIPPFRENRMFERPEAIPFIGAILWYASYRMNRFFYKKNHLKTY